MLSKQIYIKMCCQVVCEAAGEPELSKFGPRTAAVHRLAKHQCFQHSWVHKASTELTQDLSLLSTLRKTQVSRLQLHSLQKQNRLGRCQTSRQKPSHYPKALELCNHISLSTWSEVGVYTCTVHSSF